jgi:hypothetical protein
MGTRKASAPFVPNIIAEVAAEPTRQEIRRLDAILGKIVDELIEHERLAGRHTKACRGEIVETDSFGSSDAKGE